MQKHTCCFTGHRPEKLSQNEKEIKKLLEVEICKAIEQGYYIFISGMATGVDIWAAEIVMSKKLHNKRVQLICAIPHPKFEQKRTKEEQKLYNEILSHADSIAQISDKYFPGCYQVRNKWMVDSSSLVIAIYNNIKGGTRNTIEYATKKNKKIINILDFN